MKHPKPLPILPLKVAAYQNDASASPAVILLHEVLRQRREQESSDPASANGNPGREGPTSVEVVRNDDDSGDVTEG